MKIFKQIKALIPEPIKIPIRKFRSWKFRGFHYPVRPYSANKLTRIYKNLDTYGKKQLTRWLRYCAGSQDFFAFRTRATNGLMLQQVTEEYADYLTWLKTKNIKKYLEIGIGSGSSFFINNIFIKKSAELSIAVDNVSYDCFGDQLRNINDKFETLRSLNRSCTFKFYQGKSDDFFRQNSEKFDLIFIDADHGYDSVKSDYDHALRALSPNGYIIFHDIANEYYPGVIRLWKEITGSGANVIEYVTKNNYCGIGILSLN